ncbi:hypothetical protein DR864_24575 [Runella rosea]|uniref:DUF4097 domain-containing protein n=1 Tax=Runella rosea TaxID=2259595 RepID=A0A344TPW0_9BACT|nr:DUF4097 family beta strand repeat-containing protein [Runella rosea]AXE20681.1 hypothetical protein DR864_24575 [Runella rosea]
MKTTHISIAVLALTMTYAAPLVAQNEVKNEIKEQLVVPLSDPNKPGSLRVSLINGSIHVIGYAGKEVVIDAIAEAYNGKKTEHKNDELAAGMKKISTNGGIDITAEERNNTIKVTSQFMKRPMNLTIKVPQQFGLKVSTVNNGDILIENVSGELEINNVNGAIKLTNVSGSAVATTVNGGVKATFKSINAESPMAFTSLNGSVDVTFPPSAKFDVKLKSDRGEIYSDFDVDVDKTQPKANRVSKDGMYKVSVDDWIQGKVNGGGSEIMMKNMHGNIYIRKAK